MPPEHVLGRDELIERYWRKLETHSIALIAPRRVGKTSITKRMIAYPPEQFLVHARDLEDLDSVVHFVRALFEDVEAHLRKFTRAVTHGRALLANLGIVQIKELAFNGRERDAMALLDSLRAARQNYPNVRMVLTGSIGLPEIERRLRAAGHRNRALNDVAAEIVPLFDEANARVVTAALVRGAKVDVNAEIVDAIVERSEGHPMIIQLLVEGLKAHERVDVAAVDAEFRKAVEPPGDPLDLRYYAERIDLNFDAEAAELVRAILDAIALEPGQTLTELLAGIPGAPSRTQLSDLLRHLIDDFYIVRDGQKHDFRLRFLRDFWVGERGL